MNLITEYWPLLSSVGGFLVVCLYLAFKHLTEVKESLDKMLIPMEGLQTSINTLNINMATVIADRKNDKETIDEIKTEIKSLWKTQNAR